MKIFLFYLVLTSFLLIDPNLIYAQIRNPKTAKELGYDVPDSYPQKATRGRRNGRYGFHDYQYVYVPAVYDYLPKKYSNFMVAKIDNHYGVINKKGETIIPFQYDSISIIYDDYETDTKSGYLEVRQGNLYGLIDTLNNIVVPVQYTTLKEVAPKLYSYGNKTEGYGLIHQNGKVAIQNKYSIPIYRLGSTPYLILKQENKYSFINNDGVLMFTKEYDLLRVTFYSKKILIKEKGKYGLLDENLNAILPLEYSFIKELRNKKLIVEQDGLRGLLNENFDIIIPLKYRGLDISSRAFFTYNISMDGSDSPFTKAKGVLDTLGKEILPPKYSDIRLGRTPNHLIFAKSYQSPDDFRALAEKAKSSADIPVMKYSVFSAKGKLIQADAYSYIHQSIGGDFVVVTKDRRGMQGLINQKGEVVLDFQYSNIDYFKMENDVIILKVTKDGVKGIIKLDKKKNYDFISSSQQPKDSKSTNAETNYSKTIIKGNWYEIVTYGTQQFLVQYTFNDSEYGTRFFIDLTNRNTVQVAQGFKSYITKRGRKKELILTQLQMQLTGDQELAKILTTKYRQQIITPKTLSIVFDDNKTEILKELTSAKKLGTTDLNLIFEALQLTEEMQQNIDRKSGSTSSTIFSITPDSLFLKVNSYLGEDKIGQFIKKEGVHYLQTKYWEQDDHYSLWGVWKNVHYITPDGKLVTGDLDICFESTKNQKFWFRPTNR